MYDHLPSGPDDDDDVHPSRMSESSRQAHVSRETALRSLRRSVAQRWSQIHQVECDSHREVLECQMHAFLERLASHFEPVSFCAPLWAKRNKTVTTPKKRKSLGDTDSPLSSSTPDASESNFDWLFLDLNGDVWGIIKAVNL